MIALAGVGLPAWAEQAAPARPHPLTPQELTEPAVNRSFDLSPSGRYLASVRRSESSYLIVISDLETQKVQGLPFADGRVDWIQWVSDERFLVAATFFKDMYDKLLPLAVVDGGLKRVQPVSRLFAMDRNGGNVKMLLAGNRDVRANPDLAGVVGYQRENGAPVRALIPAFTYDSLDLFAVDLQSGEGKRIAEGSQSTRDWFVDREGQPAFRIDRSVSGKQAFIYARTQAAGAPDKIEWAKVQTIRLRREDNQSVPSFQPVHPGPEPNTYYVAASPEGADTTGVYLYNFVERKYLKTLATVGGVDVEAFFVDPRTQAYLGVEYHADRHVTRFGDANIQQLIDGAARYFGPEVDVYVEGLSEGRDVWLLYTEGPRDAGTWHVYRLKENLLQEVGRRWPGVDPARLGVAQPIRFLARDGLEIGAYLTLPPGYRKGDRPPLIVMPHGGPEVRDYFGFDPTAQLLASRGYQVLQPNYRGSSGFGQAFAKRGHGQWGLKMQDDLGDALGVMVKNGLADKGRACIVGMSYGGYAALAAATLTPDSYRCAASIAGVSHLRKQLKHDRRATIGDDASWDEVRIRIEGGADDASLDARSPANLANAVKIPILLVHGTADGNVPVEQSELMDKALRAAGKDVRFVKIEGMGHGQDRHETAKVYAALVEFLGNHLPVEASASAK